MAALRSQASEVAALHTSTTAIHGMVLELEAWRREQDRVLKHMTCDGLAIVIDTDLVVHDANLHVYTDAPGHARIGQGNLVVGTNHTFSLASNGFVAGHRNSISGEAASRQAGT